MQRDRGGRRRFLSGAARATAGALATDWLLPTVPCGYGQPAAVEDGSPDLVRGVEVVTLRKGRDGGTAWFHPRACMVPGDKGAIGLMTLQDIAGSDVFGPVHWSESRDLGVTWSEPRPIAGLGRRALAGGVEEGVCDVVPEYHAPTRTVLAIGHSVFYKGGKFFADQPPRFPVYVVRDAAGQWSAPQKLTWDDPRATAIYTCGCAQRVTLANGDVLIPLSFGPKGRIDRGVATVLCLFDGKKLTIQKVGNELRKPVKRGLLEPSLAALGGRYYLTIRAEDNRGYVTTSADGLRWREPLAWAWEDGQPLEMSTTQQRWLVHSERLYLVYTRKAPENVNVVRWRAPLYLAAVDPERLRLVRATERVAVPLVGDGVHKPQEVAHLGNFHTTAAGPHESWVTVGEVIPKNFRGDLVLARVRWTKPNELASPARR